MKYHDKDTLCLEFDELVPALMGKPAYDQAKKRGNITVIGRAAFGKSVLIEYESLPAKYKQAVLDKYGDPYVFITKQPLLDYVKTNWDYKAEQFYNDYVLESGRKLPEDYVEKYAKAITWLNAIEHFTTDKKALKSLLNISLSAFWAMVGDLIRAKEVSLPINERRLKDKLKQYKDKGLACMIEAWRFGNDYSAKVKDEVAEALLLELIAHPHKHDDTVIAANYNKWAMLNNRAVITPAAVGVWRRKSQAVVTLTRDGQAINYNKFSKRTMRDRPSAPLLLINSDDNVLDLFFKNGKSDYYRPTGYFIVDGYNDYILGYAIGATVTIDLIKQAYLNAIRHVMELTGECYLWHQIQTDRWSIDPQLKGELATFFSNQATYTPATVKVSQAKYIERTFGTVWHQQLKFFPNYSGQNITAKEKMNPDAIQLARKNYPEKQFVPATIAQFVENMRQTINAKTGLTRQSEWLQGINKGVHPKVRLISTEKRLQLFGVTHNYTNKITAEGIRMEINHQKLFFEVPRNLYMDTLNKTVQVTYDPYDMSAVLVSDGKGLRFVAREYQKMPSALADHTTETRSRLADEMEFKKAIQQTINTAYTERREILEREGIDAQSILQAGVLNKQVNHRAQKVITGHSGDDEEVFDWRKAI